MESRIDHAVRWRRGQGGFSLIELLVVVAVISVLMAVALPVFGSVRRQMRVTRDMAHSRQTTGAEITYAHDNNGRFADSVATIWTPRRGWDSYEPSTLVNVDFWPRGHRNQSEYLGEYLSKVEYVDCPEGPGSSQWLRDVWEAGDDWDPGSWQMGRKCFWRNFKGLSEDGDVVKGPKTAYRRGEGKVLISCLLNYGRGASKRLMSSSHFRRAHRECPSVKNNFLWPDLWMGDVAESEVEGAMGSLRLQAGYVDGHVESENASDTMGVWVTSEPFLLTGGPSLRGMYYLPLGGLR